jgi:hypothetical protein
MSGYLIYLFWLVLLAGGMEPWRLFKIEVGLMGNQELWLMLNS